MGSVARYVEGLLRHGRHHFTTQDAAEALDSDPRSVARALARLKAKGELVSPQRGFHVLVPPRYRVLGCLPAEQFVPLLMDHVGVTYHVALLSAAQLHGASHHMPQRFQVMVDSQRKPIVCGAIHVDFHVRLDVERAAVQLMNTPRGPMRVSTPETTALEIVGYSSKAGGLDNVATVLADLSEVLDAGRLAVEAAKVPLAWVQRLGYLLDLVEAGAIADSLLPLVDGRAHRVAPLDARRPRTGAPRSQQWRVAINIDVDPDR